MSKSNFYKISNKCFGKIMCENILIFNIIINNMNIVDEVKLITVFCFLLLLCCCFFDREVIM